MKQTATPWTQTGRLKASRLCKFGATGWKLAQFEETVPAGTKCINLGTETTPQWVVQDLSFIADKKSSMHDVADTYGIQIPVGEIEDIKNC